MATLTESNYTSSRHFLHDNAYDNLQTEDPILTKQQLRDGIQAIEDWWEDNKIDLKSDIDTAVGQTISNPLAKQMYKWWLKYKYGVE